MIGRLILALMTIFALVLSACGDSSIQGDDGNVEPPILIPPQIGGIWEGTATDSISDPDLTPKAITILTTDDGQFRLVSNFAVQAEGTVVLSGDDDDIDNLDGIVMAFAPQGFFFSDGAETSGCTIEAVLEEEVKIEGSYSCETSTGTDSGTFSAAYQSVYEQDSSIDRVAGVWANSSLYVEIDNKGSIVSGQFSNGCIVTGGMVGTIDTDFNLYSLNMTVDLPAPGGGNTCAEFAQPTTDYLGLAFLETDNPDHGGQDALTLQIDNGANITTQILLR